MSHDQKVMALLPPMEKCPINFLLLLLPKFDNSSPSVTWDKEICHVIDIATDTATAWGGVPNGTLSMMFTCCPNLMFLASPWLEIQRFQIGHFASLRSSKLIFILLSLGKPKMSLFGPFYWLWTGHSYFTQFG